MLATARELMLERGNEDFTLQEVSSRGKVSIGSIYLRFENKDSLVRAVLLQATQNLAREEHAMHVALAASCASLGEFVPRYVEAYAEVLRVNAPLLRLTMMRAEQDPQISALGKQAALRAVQKAVAAFMTYRHEFAGPDPELAAASAHHIIFATLARELSLGSSSESVTNYNWDVLKRELARMCVMTFQ
jgi:AcrR family transcriptional regulator